MAKMSDPEFITLREQVKAIQAQLDGIDVEQRDHRKFHHDKINSVVLVSSRYFEDMKAAKVQLEAIDRRLTAIESTSFHNIALAAAKEAVRQSNESLFGNLGVNIADFNALQNFRDDLDYVSNLRSASTNVRSRALLSVVAVLTGGSLIAVWEGIKAWISTLR